MAKYAMELTDEFVVEMDLSPGAPRLDGVSLDFRAATADEFRDMISALGGADAFRLDEHSRLQVRYGVKLTRDGEEAGRATVQVWLDEGLRQPAPVYEPVARLIHDGEAVREQAIHAAAERSGGLGL